MIKTTPYLSFLNAKEALAYYEQAMNAYDITREPLDADFATQMNYPLDNLSETTRGGSFTILGNLIIVSDEFNFPKQLSVLIAFERSDLKQIEAYYNDLVTRNLVTILDGLQKDPFGNYAFQIIDKYGITWFFTELEN